MLADRADALVFLSATLLNLGNHDLYNLVHLLDESSFPDTEVFENQIEPDRHLNAVAVGLAAVVAEAPPGPPSRGRPHRCRHEPLPTALASDEDDSAEPTSRK
ncbi:hypothetical protein [Streptomyces sp. NPDC047061]|uniref:hypothetical protein n=1 Tax=Streptomyces sp. NPDC047061 TaxID=3154605 RepID=UPI0033E05A85